MYVVGQDQILHRSFISTAKSNVMYTQNAARWYSDALSVPSPFMPSVEEKTYMQITNASVNAMNRATDLSLAVGPL